MEREIESIKIVLKNDFDTFTNDDGKLTYAVIDNEYNNLYIMQKGLTIAYYPQGCWLRLYITYTS